MLIRDGAMRASVLLLTRAHKRIIEVNGARCAVLRDLAAKRRGMASVLERLPVLREQNNDDAEWDIVDPEQCLEVVSELQSLGPAVCVEWPAGKKVTAADYVIIADPWWNPAFEDQAAGRAHRMGQQRPVTVYRLVIKDSVEELTALARGE